MTLLKYQDFIERSDLRDNPEDVFVFGDNLTGTGYGGQAEQMRGEPNAVGIPTKRSPYQYLNDKDFWDLISIYTTRFKFLHKAIDDGRIVVWPSDGIGTGLSKLKKKSPRCWALLQLFTEDFKESAVAMEKEITDV